MNLHEHIFQTLITWKNLGVYNMNNKRYTFGRDTAAKHLTNKTQHIFKETKGNFFLKKEKDICFAVLFSEAIGVFCVVIFWQK